MRRQEGQAGALWLVLVDKKEPAKKVRTTGFKVIGEAGKRPRKFKGESICRKNGQEHWMLQNHQIRSEKQAKKSLETSGLTEVPGVTVTQSAFGAGRQCHQGRGERELRIGEEVYVELGRNSCSSGS